MVIKILKVLEARRYVILNTHVRQALNDFMPDFSRVEYMNKLLGGCSRKYSITVDFRGSMGYFANSRVVLKTDYLHEMEYRA
jgi:hypothetical protein